MQIDAVVYWIRLPEHTDPKSQGYIGVSKKFSERMAGHLKDICLGRHRNPHLINAVKKYGWDNLIKEIVYSGEELSCYLKENEIRPNKGIGWNISPGGHRGPGWPSGRKKSKESIERQKATMLEKNKQKKEESFKRKAIQIAVREQKRLDKIANKERRLQERLLKKIERENKLLRRAAERERRKKKKIAEGTIDMAKDFSNRPICSVCNKNRCALNYYRGGVPHYRSKCDACGKKTKNIRPGKSSWELSGYRKKPTCDVCGFKSLYSSQLTVYYIDGDLTNNKYNNLRTVCLNCVEVVKRKEITWKRGDLTPD